MTQKEIIDFIMKREVRYFVKETYAGYSIGKAYRVDIAGSGEHWISLDYGRASVISPKKTSLFKSRAEAEVHKKKLAAQRAQKKAKDKEALKKKIEELAVELRKVTKWEMKTDAMYDPLIVAVRNAYSEASQTSEERQYIDMIERYIKTGVFTTRGKSFRKEQVAFVEYGQEKAVRITLVDGTTITPCSENFCKLIRLVFGDDNGGYYLPSITYAEGVDKIERPKRSPY